MQESLRNLARARSAVGSERCTTLVCAECVEHAGQHLATAPGDVAMCPVDGLWWYHDGLVVQEIDKHVAANLAREEV